MVHVVNDVCQIVLAKLEHQKHSADAYRGDHRIGFPFQHPGTTPTYELLPLPTTTLSKCTMQGCCNDCSTLISRRAVTGNCDHNATDNREGSYHNHRDSRSTTDTRLGFMMWNHPLQGDYFVRGEVSCLVHQPVCALPHTTNLLVVRYGIAISQRVHHWHVDRAHHTQRELSGMQLTRSRHCPDSHLLGFPAWRVPKLDAVVRCPAPAPVCAPRRRLDAI